MPRVAAAEDGFWRIRRPLDAGVEALAGRVLSLPIIPVNVKDSLARIAPSETTIGPPSTTARHLVNASLSDNTRRAYAGALG